MGMPFIIQLIEIGSHMDAFGLVYRRVNPNTIFLNPIMLLRMMKEEIRDPKTALTHAYFLGLDK